MWTKQNQLITAKNKADTVGTNVKSILTDVTAQAIDSVRSLTGSTSRLALVA